MYRKPTENFQYLHRTSSHPDSVFKGLIKGETLRIVRNCSDKKTQEEETAFFHEKLTRRGYNPTTLKSISQEILNTSRENLLQHTGRKSKKDLTPPLVMVTKFHPAIRKLSRTIRKHWKHTQNDPECQALFKNLPMIAYKREKNLGDFIISSKLRG